ncbi:hypothetical protein PMAYCL1PPCAC_11002, partial [Pristionchus mayeri]
ALVPPLPALLGYDDFRARAEIKDQSDFDRASFRSLSPNVSDYGGDQRSTMSRAMRKLCKKILGDKKKKNESSAPSTSLQRRSHVDTTFAASAAAAAAVAPPPPPPRQPSPYRSQTDLDTSEAQDYDTMLGTQSIHHRSPMLSTGVRKTTNPAYYTGPPSSSNSGSTPTKSVPYANGNSISHFSSSTNGQPITRIAVAVPNGRDRSSPRLSALLSNGGSGSANGLNGSTPNGSSNGTSSQRSSVASYSSHVSGYGSSSTPTAANGGVSPTRNRRSPQSQKSASPISEDALVVVRMKPDTAGRFGFNVKGGADQNYPVIVSRIAAGSSADKCYPRLNEGDQVVLINGRDISALSHDRVVSLIRSARSAPGGGELMLTIRPNVYRLGGEDDDTSSSSAVLPPPPVSDSVVPESVPRSHRLAHSLHAIRESLANGQCLAQFEAAYRKKVGLTMNDCIKACNLAKNRYRDVCPYDSTRVFLQQAASGDYINASFVNMDIPVSGIVNRYIACQGPLSNTVADFWQMVWEQLCTTIVMLTTTVERGRTKCHQYWPRLHESLEVGTLSLTCIKERETKQCAYREFSLKDKTSGEERRVTQMQYTAWPDHGVPDDPSHFIEFVGEVRRARAGSVDPIVVHCSAGIGRTGVLILMETAACLVEANEPVYPLELVKTMRDQRAMLIQTAGQYTFVCESILRAFNDGIIKPLAEYCKR